MIKKIFNFFDKPFFKNPKYISIVWIVITLLAIIRKYFNNRNNYLIYKNVFWHVIHQTPLYTEYPAEYSDINHYGPVFSLIIAPFALLPDYLGVPLWSLFSTILIIWAIRQLPLQNTQIAAILWLCLNESLITAQNFQINSIMVMIIVMSYVFISKKKDFWSAMLIALGTFIKLYGIVGLAFFFFSKNKTKFSLSMVFWSIIFFIAPMFISSKQYILSRYVEWYERLLVKNEINAVLDSYQDISVMGVFRRLLRDASIPNTPFLIVGLVFFMLPYLRINCYKNKNFQLLLLASTLIFTVIFSSGSESPTYIIAFVGVAIWYVIKPFPKSKLDNFLIIFAILLTSLSKTDLFPRYIIENYIRKYSLKALPCIIIWCVIIYEMCTAKFEIIKNGIVNDVKNDIIQ